MNSKYIFALTFIAAIAGCAGDPSEDDSSNTNQVVAPIEPTETVDPTEPTEPTDPEEPTEPTDPEVPQVPEDNSSGLDDCYEVQYGYSGQNDNGLNCTNPVAAVSGYMLDIYAERLTDYNLHPNESYTVITDFFMLERPTYGIYLSNSENLLSYPGDGIEHEGEVEVFVDEGCIKMSTCDPSKSTFPEEFFEFTVPISFAFAYDHQGLFYIQPFLNGDPENPDPSYVKSYASELLEIPQSVWLHVSACNTTESAVNVPYMIGNICETFTYAITIN